MESWQISEQYCTRKIKKHWHWIRGADTKTWNWMINHGFLMENSTAAYTNLPVKLFAVHTSNCMQTIIFMLKFKADDKSKNRLKLKGKSEICIAGHSKVYLRIRTDECRTCLALQRSWIHIAQALKGHEKGIQVPALVQNYTVISAL